MTNSERITAHNARLAAMKETVAELPEAGGGGSVETVDVPIKHYAGSGYDVSKILYQTIDGTGKVVMSQVPSSTFASNDFVISNVVCPSIIYIVAFGSYPVLGQVNETLYRSNGTIFVQVNGSELITVQPSG